ncbi:MAG: undecaprenyl-diphosphatase UppP [Patescibacteria group bacterium]|nr:undecaprenyl-diphosphatase UppP [Patescibacteria group bacterium]
MLILKASFLAILQALTEFLPISSSGHLIMLQKIFNLTDFDLTFDVLLHFGSALALIILFYKDWVKIFKDGVKDFKKSLLLKIIIALVPAVILGFILDKLKLPFWHATPLIVFNLIFFGLILWLADKQKGKGTISSFNWQQIILIGLFQALALFPGVSRSGITISIALFLGLSRAESARFSFLLATPAILGATILELKDFTDISINLIWPYIIGLIISFMASYVIVAWFLNYLKNNRLWPFALYRLILGLIIILLLIFNLI